VIKLFTVGKVQAADRLDERWTLDALPPFPAVAVRALNLMAGTETSLRELCDLIRTDPAFSAAVLRLANSPLIGFSKEITSVLQASMLLGFRRLQSVAVTIGLKVYLEGSYTPLLRACWRHSIACAILAERSAKWSAFDKASAHTAGTMHDIGRLAMAFLMPQSYARVVEQGADHPADLLQIEREICGLDHCEAGLALVNAWNLPGSFVEITSCHHDTRPVAHDIVSLLRPCCLLADALGFRVVRYRSTPSYEDVLDAFPEGARNALPASARDLANEITREIRLIEAM
jgi:HD-like signal output (HDOD) protein